MEDIKKAKAELRERIAEFFNGFPHTDTPEKEKRILAHLFELANFVEANIVLLYSAYPYDTLSKNLIQKTLDSGKIVAVPVFFEKNAYRLYKIDRIDKSMKWEKSTGLVPIRDACREIPVESLDIAIVPGLSFDEKGSRLGQGKGNYDEFIPQLPITARKVSLAFEEQVVPLVPVNSSDKHVDIVITDTRIIYKI